MAPNWSAEEKASAVAAYVESGILADGQRAVAREDGTQPGKHTVARWAAAAGHDPQELSARAAEKTQRATRASALKWQDRRAEMLDDLGLVADEALAQTAFFLMVGNPRNAKDAATTCAILIDKAQVLSGDASAIVRFPWKVEDVHAEAQPRADHLRGLHAVEAV